MLTTNISASTLVTPSETEIAKACAVVDTGSHTAINMVTTEERSYKELSPPGPGWLWLLWEVTREVGGGGVGGALAPWDTLVRGVPRD